MSIIYFSSLIYDPPPENETYNKLPGITKMVFITLFICNDLKLPRVKFVQLDDRMEGHFTNNAVIFFRLLQAYHNLI